jgi:hypothetical protein
MLQINVYLSLKKFRTKTKKPAVSFDVEMALQNFLPNGAFVNFRNYFRLQLKKIVFDFFSVRRDVLRMRRRFSPSAIFRHFDMELQIV